MGIGKTLSHWREAAFEKTGRHQTTDLPEEYRTLENDFRRRTGAINDAVRLTKQSFKYGAHSPASQIQFGQSLILSGNELPDDSALSYTLVKVGELQERLGANQHTFESLTRNNYISSWNRFLEIDVATAQQAVRKVHIRRLEYDQAAGNTNDLQSPYYVSEKYLEAGRRLQASMNTAMELMQRVTASEEYQRTILLQFLDAQYEYYKACACEVDAVRKIVHQTPPPTWTLTHEAKPVPDLHRPKHERHIKPHRKFVPPPLPVTPSAATFSTAIIQPQTPTGAAEPSTAAHIAGPPVAMYQKKGIAIKEEVPSGAIVQGVAPTGVMPVVPDARPVAPSLLASDEARAELDREVEQKQEQQVHAREELSQQRQEMQEQLREQSQQRQELQQQNQEMLPQLQVEQRILLPSSATTGLSTQVVPEQRGVSLPEPGMWIRETRQREPSTRESTILQDLDAPATFNMVSPAEQRVLEPIGLGKVLFNFSSDDPTCLRLNKGDQVQMIKKYPQGWCYGDLNGQKGFFPESFVEPVQ